MSAPRAAHVVVGVDVDAPAQQVWDALVDWDSQQAWMIGTQVQPARHGGHGVGAGISARTGLGPVGFTDPMTVTEWAPPHRCVMRHDGSLVQGSGAFEVVDIGDGRSCFLWSEDLRLPFGPLGALGWRVVRPLARAGMARSARRFAASVEGRL
jgi:uncharacterized protein YndB with AHSA1/START domain